MCPIFRNKEVKVLYIGLDAVGKTTLLFRLKLGEVVSTIPTIGFNVEKVEHNGLTMVTWDVSSRDKMRSLWRHYYDMMDAVVFMMDSTDRERLGEAVEELRRVIDDVQLDYRDLPMLVLANKQDKEGALSPDEIRDAINGRGHRFRMPLEVFPTSGLTGEGVSEALDWLTTQLAVIAAEKSLLAPVTRTLYNTVQYPASVVKSSLRTLSDIFWTSKNSEGGGS